MKSNFVYAKRNSFCIYLRKIKYTYLNKIIKLYKKLFFNRNKNIKHVLLLPKFRDIDNLKDYLNRVSWAILPDDNFKLYVYVSKEIITDDLYSHRYQKNYIQKDRIRFVVDRKELKNVLRNVNTILVWKHWFVINMLLSKHLSKVKLIDKFLYSSKESVALYKLKSELLTNDEYSAVKKLSLTNYMTLLKNNIAKKKSYVFLTGPSFDNYKDFRYEDNSFKVICNTIVKNKTFLDYINGPDLITFADPSFHFSPCEYSARFRDEVVSTVEAFGTYVMVPLFTVPLLLQHYPLLEKYLIGIDVQNTSINFPTLTNFWVKSAPSIISYMMIPVASVVANEIYIIGADGRKENEKYFWQHNKSVQFHDLMESVFQTHPAFFRDTYYSDNYSKHINYLEEMFAYGEQMGKKYYSLTPSYVPALQKRQIINDHE